MKVTYDNPIDSFGDLMTVAEWRDCVQDGAFRDYDGWGSLVKDGLQSNTNISPSQAHLIPPDATHINWYNR